MIKDKGVYTTKCPKCTRLTVMHLSADGSISPNHCTECELEFEGLDKGEERNTFVIVPKSKAPKIAVNVVKEETNIPEKKSSIGQSFTLKTKKKSSRNKTGKKSSLDGNWI